MTRAVAISALMVAALLSGCEHTQMSRVPAELRQEASIRTAECDVLARSIAPSRDRSGSISILGQGIGLREAVISNTGARDQYLIGILNLITQCRRWQRFEISAQEYRDAQSTLAATVTSAVDAAAVDQTLTRLADALAQAHQESGARAEELLTSFREASLHPQPAGTQDPELTRRLTRIEELIGGRSGTEGGPAVSGFREWRVSFASGSAQPNPQQLSPLVEGVTAWRAICPGGWISIIGFADNTGSESHNLQLGKARADVIYSRISTSPGLMAAVSSGGRTDIFGDDLEANRVVIVRATCTG